MNGYTELEMQLLNDFQHNFPLVSRPFAHIADRLQVSENSVLTHLWRLRTLGAVSRVGPVFSPGCIGASTLAALAVPQAQVEPMAEWISGLPEVNHNYQREHDYNLWFVVTAANEIHLQQVLDRIARHSHWPMLTLPLLERFHIDLGFDLNGVGRRPCTLGSSDRVQLDDGQVSLVAALQWLARSVDGKEGLVVEVQVEDAPELDAESQTVLFRVAQEALANIARHAAASHALVRLGHRAGLAVMTIWDDGRGFDVAAADRRARRSEAGGLSGMRERLGLHGGQLQVESGPEGTRLRATLPLARSPG